MHNQLSRINPLILLIKIPRHAHHTPNTKQRETHTSINPRLINRPLLRLECNSSKDTSDSTTNHASRSSQAPLTVTDDIVGLIGQHTWDTELQERDSPVSAEETHGLVLGKGRDAHSGYSHDLVEGDDRAADLVLICDPGGQDRESGSADSWWSTQEERFGGGETHTLLQDDGKKVGVSVTGQSGGQEHDGP